MDIETTQKDRSNLPWVERYRPSNLEELISHTHIINTIRRYIDEKSLPNLLFYGPPGTGKTSTIVACAKMMYGKNYSMMCLELNASDSRGIEVVREIIKTFAETQIPFNTSDHLVKLIILDEADAMTRDAQAALRRIMEKYSRTTRFCMICNYVSKIIPALQSRTTRFKFKQIPREDAAGRLKQICKAENINITDEAVHDVIKISEGDMRKMVNTLQNVHMFLQSSEGLQNKLVDRTMIFKLTGFPNPDDIQKIFEMLATSDDIQKTYEGKFRLTQAINEMRRNKGISLASLLKDICDILITVKTPGNLKGNLYQRMAEIEYRLSIGCSEEKQLASLIGGFVETRAVKST